PQLRHDRGRTHDRAAGHGRRGALLAGRARRDDLAGPQGHQGADRPPETSYRVAWLTAASGSSSRRETRASWVSTATSSPAPAWSWSPTTAMLKRRAGRTPRTRVSRPKPRPKRRACPPWARTQAS